MICVIVFNGMYLVIIYKYVYINKIKNIIIIILIIIINNCNIINKISMKYQLFSFIYYCKYVYTNGAKQVKIIQIQLTKISS